MIDLNTATAEELDSVPVLRGHGFEIVRYREERGRFTSLRQLDEVPGLAGKADGAADVLTVEASGSGDEPDRASHRSGAV
jgi:competence protein ComEA